MTVECDNSDVGAAQSSVTYQVSDEESVSMSVVRAVASASGRSPIGTDGVTEALEPLAGAIDPDSLDDVFESNGEAAADEVVVAFDYCDHRVTVRGADAVSVSVE